MSPAKRTTGSDVSASRATKKKPAKSAKPAALATSAAAAAASAQSAAARPELVPFPEASRPAGRSGKYVYCIIQTKEPRRFGPIGIGSDPAEVHTVSYQDIAAVVSDTPLEVYDPTRENVLAHERVNEAVMRDYTVIPMSFSTVFKTSEDIV
ncbi:MAG TPA: GvpL/GvpF family gas vesicle protein, partial [Thermoanaerobaculia bacterium]|nr:GvpL/GvpF family gas vesicle protein [Thermoanaerobaculia bacterium]